MVARRGPRSTLRRGRVHSACVVAAAVLIGVLGASGAGLGLTGCVRRTEVVEADPASGRAAAPASGRAAAPASGRAAEPAAEPAAGVPRVLRVVVTNDDGVAAPGIDTMVRALEGLDWVEVTVVAPPGERSGSGDTRSAGPLSSEATTTASGRPAITVRGATPDSGFPADQVLWAVDRGHVDLVIAGVNNGQNVGTAVGGSGTLGAARAAVSRGVPALAVSQGSPGAQFEVGARATIRWLSEHRDAARAGRLPVEVVSLNVPSCAPGASPRGLVVVPTARDARGRDPAAPADCTATRAPGPDDMDAFTAGFITESRP